MKGRIEKRRRFVAFAYVDCVLTLCDVCFMCCVCYEMFCLCVSARETWTKSEEESVCVCLFEFNSIQSSRPLVHCECHNTPFFVWYYCIFATCVYEELEKLLQLWQLYAFFWQKHFSPIHKCSLLIEHCNLYLYLVVVGVNHNIFFLRRLLNYNYYFFLFLQVFLKWKIWNFFSLSSDDNEYFCSFLESTRKSK